MKRVLLSIAFLLLVAGVSAREVTQQTAREAAVSFATALSPLRSIPVVELVYTAGSGSSEGLRLSGYPLFYIYNVGQQNGFVLIAGDDTAYPVLGYADEGMFRTDSLPANLVNWLLFYENEIAAQIASGRSASDETAQAWRALLAGTPQAATARAFYATAAWDQLAPYNDLCPRIKGQLTYSGCVATAMAIAMKYHQWPSKATGSVSYLTATDTIAVTATLGDTYNWGNMLNTYRQSVGGAKQWTDAQGAEVAKLIFHCGAAVYTDFTLEYGSAFSSDALYAFINNFGYDVGGYLANRELYTATEWDALLQRELNDKRILFYGGSSDEAGHQFIIDGYDSSSFYHVNWGWSGYMNGYFRLNALNPTDGVGYVYHQTALIGLQKPVEGSVPRYEFYFFDYPYASFWGLKTDNESITSGEPFTLYISWLADHGFRDFNGYFSVCLADSEGEMKEVLETLRPIELPGGYSLSDLEGDTYTITSPITEGDVVQLMYSLDGKIWKKVRGITPAVTELPVGVSLTANEVPAPDATVSILSASIADGIILSASTQTLLRDVRLYDLSGRMVKHLPLPVGETTVHLSAADLPAGIYVLTATASDGNHRFTVGIR